MAIPISRYYNLLNAFSKFDTENDSIEILKKIYESEGKSMIHNVTVKHEENKVIEKYWLLRAMKNSYRSDFMISTSELHIGKGDLIIKEQELDHEPTTDEIAQFLSESGADFVSVVQNYRFENELPFC